MNTKNIIIRYYKKLTMREKGNRDIIRKSEKRIIDGECESIIKISHKTDFTFDFLCSRVNILKTLERRNILRVNSRVKSLET